LSGDNGGGIRLIDLEKNTVTYFAAPSHITTDKYGRIRKVAFTEDENHHMIVVTDEDIQSYAHATVFLIKRNSPTESGVDAFKTNGELNKSDLIKARQCNGIVVHPKTNAPIWTMFTDAEVYKYPNLETHPDLKGNSDAIYEITAPIDMSNPEEAQLQFGFGESAYEMYPVIHPEGKYLYVISINQNFITKSLYDENSETFGQPIWFVGSSAFAGFGGGYGYVDDITMKAKVWSPREGVFVKNEEYVKAGREDVYDFYFTDRLNHCIRKVTPEGVVTTFAGRGRVAEGTAYGYADGLARTEAMFDQPCAITYSEKRKAFYIGDWINKRLRVIYRDDE
jgi:hypothetical protein